jgi:hypothetical protein
MTTVYVRGLARVANARQLGFLRFLVYLRFLKLVGVCSKSP